MCHIRYIIPIYYIFSELIFFVKKMRNERNSHEILTYSKRNYLIANTMTH